MGWSESGKRAEWQERLRRFRTSGMTVTRFCEVERVSAPSFYQWRRKLNAAAGSTGGAPVFQQVVVTPAASSPRSGLLVRLASGAEIEVGAGDLEVIRAVVGELARAECEFAAEPTQEDAGC
jgi:hypothetical protein